MDVNTLIAIIVGAIIIVGIAVGSIFYAKERHKKEETRQTEESDLYAKLLKKFDSHKNGFLYQYVQEYTEVLRLAEDAQLEHAVAVIGGNLETNYFDTIIFSGLPSVLTFTAYLYGNWIAAKCGLNVSIVAINIIVYFLTAVMFMLVILIVVFPCCKNVKTKKFFLTLFQKELERREFDNNMKVRQLEIQVEQLGSAVLDLKKENSRVEAFDTLDKKMQQVQNDIHIVKEEMRKSKGKKILGIHITLDR